MVALALTDSHPNVNYEGEAVNEILTRRDDDRFVCEHDARMGYLIPRGACLTYREAERQHRDALHFMATLRQVPNLNTGASGL
jgi:hypothetical protein